MPHNSSNEYELKSAMTVSRRDPSKKRPINKRRIKKHVRKIARRLNSELGDEPLTIVPVFTGAMFFAVDLIKRLHQDEGGASREIIVEGVKAKSYKGVSSERIEFDPLKLSVEDVEDRTVLIVDDILDTGQTLRHVVDYIKEMKPKRLITAVLLKKCGTQRPEYLLDADHVCFHVENEFVVGYGLDFNNRYRELPTIRKLVFRDGSQKPNKAIQIEKDN